jgi:CelD/BcsL family acetyltransferase involved in cellulose biosynthesis
MKVELVERIPEFDALKSAWDSVYAADKDTHVFVSWPWLRAWLETGPHKWLVLAARERTGGPFVAFLPLVVEGNGRARPDGERVLHLGGWPLADYAGFVSSPEAGSEPISALARFVQDELAWRELRAADVMDRRLEHFLYCFSGDEYQVRHGASVCCPRIPLPGSWEDYLQQCISSKARYHLRRCIREVEALPGFRLTAVHDGDTDRHIEVLLTLWQRRWGAKSDDELGRYRHMYRRALEAGQLWLHVSWVGDVPLAALAAFVDQRRRGFYCYMTAFNPEYERLAPGKAMFGHAIQQAIEDGYRAFDLLRGGEDYKIARLGAGEHFARTSTLTRRQPCEPSRAWRHDATVRVKDRSDPLLQSMAADDSTTLGPGDKVRVRPLGQIRETLDENGCCQGCPFTRPMAGYCGRKLRVLKRVGRYYDEGKRQMLRCRNVVLLEGARCDGSRQTDAGGCNRMCLLFWRTEWLERLN